MVDVVAIALGFLQLVLGLIFAAVALYLGVKVFDRFTKGVDEMEELRRGNVAVAVVLAGFLIAVGFVLQAGVSAISAGFGV